MRSAKIVTTLAAGFLAVGVVSSPVIAQAQEQAQVPAQVPEQAADTGSLGDAGTGSADGTAGMGSSDPKLGSTGIRVADLPEIPALPALPGMSDPASEDTVLVPVPPGFVAADLPTLPLPYVWEGTPAPERITPARPDEPVIGAVDCVPGSVGCAPKVLDKTIDHCATAEDGLEARGMTWFTDGTTGYTERCAAEFFG